MSIWLPGHSQTSKCHSKLLPSVISLISPDSNYSEKHHKSYWRLMGHSFERGVGISATTFFAGVTQLSPLTSGWAHRAEAPLLGKCCGQSREECSSSCHVTWSREGYKKESMASGGKRLRRRRLQLYSALHNEYSFATCQSRSADSVLASTCHRS